MEPIFSIGIAFRNTAPYLSLCLQSLMAQTFERWEAILLDDGSTDHSLEIARTFTDPRIKLLSDGLRKGANVRRNEAVRLASAPYFAIMDADDIMHPDRLQVQYELLERHTATVVVGSDAYAIDRNSNVVGLLRAPRKQRCGFGARHSFINPTVASRTEWFRRNPWDEGYIFWRAQDAELWCRSAGDHTFLNIPRPLLYYREIGVFNFRNYAATALALVVILHTRFRRPLGLCLFRTAAELTKVIIASALVCAGVEDLLIKWRHKRLSDDERQRAGEGLECIRSYFRPGVT